MDEMPKPPVETKADKVRKRQRVLRIGIAGLALMAFIPFLLMKVSQAPQPANPDEPPRVESRHTESPAGELFWSLAGQLMTGGKAHSLSLHNMEDPGKLLDLLGMLMPIAAVGGAGLFVYARATQRKSLEFDKIGILVSDGTNREALSARFIPWTCLEKIEITDFDPQQNHSSTSADEHREKSSKAKLLFHVDDGNIVKIRWTDVVRSVEPGTFINAVKTYAPTACPEVEAVAGKAHHVDSDTYTQLWFRYYSTGAERQRTTHLPAGELLQDGRFQIIGQIGGGGQGTAYLASDAQNKENSEVVLKEYILPVHRGEQVLQQTAQKLEQEAAILRKIEHPRIVKLLGSFVEDHRGYLAMEYVEGKTLKAMVAEQGPLPEHLVIDIARQICDVLSYLHCQDPAIIHRDLTPDNLIMQADGIVKLVDFNVAHQLESSATATVVGKHCYIPPEQFRGKPNPQSDIYALGCTLHYLLTGQEPEPLTASKPRELNSAVSIELNTVVAQATALDCAKRYANIADLHGALNEAPAAKITLSQKDKVV